MKKYIFKNVKGLGLFWGLLSVSGVSFANSPPVFNEISPYNLPVWAGESLTFTLKASDPDGDHVVWSVVSEPYQTRIGTLRAWSGGGFTYSSSSNSSGTDSFLIKISDGKASNTMRLNVVLDPVSTLSYDVRYHTSTPVNQSIATSYVADATEDLRNSVNSDDIACNVNIRARSYSSFNIGDGNIDSESDFDSLPNGINFVNSITWCGTYHASSVGGCANYGGTRVAVLAADYYLANGADIGRAIAHEIGHNRDLRHRSDLGAIMNAGGLTAGDELNMSECSAYRN